ncbi:hypothetical protein IMZ11_36085 [Microtetraspora sp. AC03309]|uniref:hypothetical protein n=1 Tax=Microtetraspora sp. AC03309 TaxID=2779376 RepID=UPI001E3DF286|nr:hypothetical protein [Microtetraspora sp. AC03309]MCC5581044.1 hypothetical protein [Microtetraspora sp. AC03309]
MVLQPAMLVAGHPADLLRAGSDNLADTHTGPYADQITPAAQPWGPVGRPRQTKLRPLPDDALSRVFFGWRGTVSPFGYPYTVERGTPNKSAICWTVLSRVSYSSWARAAWSAS